MAITEFGVVLSGSGIHLNKQINRSSDGPIGYDPTLPPAKAVTAWVKIDANEGTCDLPADHGYTNGNFDVYWEGGRRYGVPGTIATNALTFNGGAGDDFPATGNLTVVVCRQVTINTFIDGDNLMILGVGLEYADMNSAQLGHLDLQDSGPASVVAIDLEANTPQVWDITGGASNVFSGNPIATIRASHNDTANSAQLKIIGQQDATP